MSNGNDTTLGYVQLGTGLLDRPPGEAGAVGYPRSVSSVALSSSIVVKSGRGILYGFTVLSTDAASQFIQVFDAYALPADGAIPAVVFTVGASSQLPVNWIPGRVFQSGCVLCNSSTAATKTLGSANCFFDVQYL